MLVTARPTCLCTQVQRRARICIYEQLHGRVHTRTLCREGVCTHTHRPGLPSRFQHGPHGYSLADETTADGSSQVLNASFAQWHDLSVEWLYRVFGALTFEDKSTSRMGQYMKELGFSLPDNPGGTNFA